jgi:N-acetyl-anhydromuramyl-L-alanine amidase AmpD
MAFLFAHPGALARVAGVVGALACSRGPALSGASGAASSSAATRVGASAAGQPEYADAEWIGADCDGKCDTTRVGHAIDTIVIHATEYADWQHSVDELLFAKGKSVHYLVGRDGRIAQFLPEGYVAWHAGNYPMNVRSIGIEHVGLLSDGFPEPEYQASARLVRHLLDKYGIRKDRIHIIGHDQVPDPSALAEGAPPCLEAPAACEADDRYGGIHHHHDPGLFWTWDEYLARIP